MTPEDTSKLLSTLTEIRDKMRTLAANSTEALKLTRENKKMMEDAIRRNERR